MLFQDVEILEKGYANSGSKSTAMTKLEFRIREGRNRQIRRMCDAVENPVLSLKRVAFGPVRLDSRLRRGDSRPLTPNEIKALKRGVGASADKLRTRKLIRS
jgi:pseudouridine synthase